MLVCCEASTFRRLFLHAVLSDDDLAIFLGMASTMCIDLGLHRLSKSSDLERETRARVWWNCYVLDKYAL
jgi:hypothetical protein